jgi:predicted nuclease of restriction endonuclease-like RecB superfamily
VLTADLVRVKFGSKLIEPRYIRTDRPADLELARSLIEIFESNVARKKRDLDADLADFLGTGTAFLLHRGLAKLLQDRCVFETRSDIEPVELRRSVFEAAARAYTEDAGRPFDRQAVLAVVAESMKIVPEDVADALYADLKDEQVLTKFKGCKPQWLLDRYNVALAQGVLLRASEMFIEIRGESAAGYRELFRRMKFFRLLHEVEGSAEAGYRLRLDGPYSVLKSSQRYGMQMASFLPGLLHCSDWELEAEVLWGSKRVRRRLQLTSKQGLKPYSSAKGQWLPEEVKWFEGQFAKLKTDWRVSSDTELVDLGGQGILIPDFVFTHAKTGKKVHLEILGFWRRGAVASRVALLKERGPENLIVAVSKELHVGEEKLAGLPGQVYVFRTSPVAREVRKLLGEFG